MNSRQEDLLTETAARAARYVASIGHQRVAPAPEEIARLDGLGGELNHDVCDSREVIALLDDLGSPATVASTGARYFGFVTGGSLPAAMAANWLAGAWERIWPVLAIERLTAIDYAYRGNLGIDGREAFRAAVNEPAHHLYVCRIDSAALRDHLTFRDYLRAHPETARGYAELKRDLARQFPDGVDRYAQSKTDFVTGVLETAGISRLRIDQIRRENGLS